MYRFWQFWKSFDPPPSQEKLDRIRLYLSPVEMILFTKMPPPDQNHSLRVFDSVLGSGENDEDLIKASLLHDIGKGLHPLTRWERIIGVLVAGFLPGLAREWGKGETRGLKRPLAVMQQHPVWGAEMAREAGCSPHAVWLIAHHEEPGPPASATKEKMALLDKLQTADNLN
jgi:putative nucleotidyltransferase with HDIG domain